MDNHLLETTPAQDLAVDVLVSGGTGSEASEAAGVCRQTVSVWRNHHPGFRAQLNKRRDELLSERVDRIRDLDAQALAVVAAAVEEGDRRAAVEWVKLRRLHSVDVETVGTTRPESIIDADAELVRRRPEHVGVLGAILDNGDDCALTRGQARDLAQSEIVGKLAEVADG